MDKKELQNWFENDFKKSKGALNEIIDHNRHVDAIILEDLKLGNFKSLEEHMVISQLILDSVKATTELYKHASGIIENINKLEEKKTSKVDIDKLLED